jgi:hypothetical protein
MPDFIFAIGLSALTFVMGVAWYSTVSPKFFQRNRKAVFQVWGGVCLGLAVFLLVVSWFHLARPIIGWLAEVWPH